MTGPLHGLRVLELASLAPAPFGCMLLADLGADVVRVDRADGPPAVSGPSGPLDRGRRTLAVDLKSPKGAGARLASSRTRRPCRGPVTSAPDGLAHSSYRPASARPASETQATPAARSLSRA